MHITPPDSPRPRARPGLRRSLSCLALTVLATVSPAVADDAPANGSGGYIRLFSAGDEGGAVPPRWRVWPMVLDLRLRGGPGHGGPMPVGLAFRIAEGVSLGAAAGFDPVSGKAIGLMAFELKF